MSTLVPFLSTQRFQELKFLIPVSAIRSSQALWADPFVPAVLFPLLLVEVWRRLDGCRGWLLLLLSLLALPQDRCVGGVARGVVVVIAGDRCDCRLGRAGTAASPLADFEQKQPILDAVGAVFAEEEEKVGVGFEEEVVDVNVDVNVDVVEKEYVDASSVVAVAAVLETAVCKCWQGRVWDAISHGEGEITYAQWKTGNE